MFSTEQTCVANLNRVTEVLWELPEEPIEP
jgi:hypothetical protein